jgi:hypothetical protein
MRGNAIFYYLDLAVLGASPPVFGVKVLQWQRRLMEPEMASGLSKKDRIIS